MKYKRVVCADGFNMSVQAGKGMYSEPRFESGVYYEVEIGFPSERESMLMQYAEDDTKPTGTVYGYVPARVVLAVIARHGGIASGEIPPLGNR
jgi:hypothetical protein